ncbi:MAG: DUF2865 domain-containing protein [Rhizobiaceae bacterium]
MFGSNTRSSSTVHNRRRNSANILNEVFAAPADADRRRRARLDRYALLQQREKQRSRKIWSSARRLKNHNTFRTVCVRRCDGYYFPVSFSTDEEGLLQDAQACSNMCPGVEMELFSHRTSTETAEQMVSTVDGTPYADLAVAFAHQKKFDPKCSCNFSLLEKDYNIDIPDSIEQAKLIKALQKDKRPPLPSWRALPQDEKADKRPPAAKLVQAETPRKDRRVRVIGDAFFPTQ